MPNNSNQEFKSENSNSFAQVNDSYQIDEKNSQNFQEVNVGYCENLDSSYFNNQYCTIPGQGYYNSDQKVQNYYNSEYNVQQNYMNAPYEFSSYQNDQYYANSYDQNQFYNNDTYVNYNVDLVNSSGSSQQKDSHNEFNNDVSYQGYHQYGSEDSNLHTNSERGSDQLEGVNYCYNRA